MELANIEKLVEKYLNAETSLEEETTLRNYFKGDSVAPHLQEYQFMFSYFAETKHETYTKTIQLEPKKAKRSNLKWLSVAASVMLLFSVFVGKQIHYKQQEKEAQKIYAQVSKGLQLLSNNLKKGEQAVAQLYTYEKTVNNVLK